MAADDTQLLLSISADTRQALRVLKKFGVDVGNVANDTEKAFNKPTDQVGKLGEAMGKSRIQTANLAAQFQDIAVQLQSGTSPFTIALQQGTQIVGALGNGQGGLRATVGALGGAFMSLVSPVSLATVALITLGGVGIQYITDMFAGTDKLDDQLKAHKDLISSIKDAYGEAAEGVDKYVAQSRTVLEAQLRASIIALSTQLRSSVSTALGEVGTLYRNRVQGEVFSASSEFKAFEAAIQNLRQSAQAGAPDVRKFREEIAAIVAADPSNKTLQEMASKLFDVFKSAGDAEEAITHANRAMSAMQGIASGSITALNDYRTALEDLAKVSLPNLTPRQQADALYSKALENAQGPGERQAASEAYLASLQRISDEEKKIADERAKREAQQAGRRASREAARDQEQIDRIIENLKFEADQLNRTTREQQVYNAVAAAGVDINSKYGQEIAGLAGHLYDLQTAQQSAIESMDELRGTAFNVLSGFAQDIRNGVDAADALKNALGRVLDSIIDIGLQQAITGLFGASGTSGGGLLGSLLGGLFGAGRAGGGPVYPGKIHPVGERGPELFVPNVSGRIIPNHALGGGNSTPGPINVTIDLKGANGDATIARIAQAAAAQGVQRGLGAYDKRLLPNLDTQARRLRV